MKHTITVNRGNNIGQSIINYLKENNIHGKVTIKTLNVERFPRLRQNVATFTV